MTNEQNRILDVCDEVNDDMPDKCGEIVSQMTVTRAEVGYADVMDALWARRQESKLNKYEPT
jgi:hypothetical protein